MTFTREERAVIEDMLNRIEALKSEIVSVRTQLNMVGDLSEVGAAKKTIADLSNSELKSLLAGVIKQSGGLIKHNHKDDKEGGPCFAELGANLVEPLIENEEGETQPETP